LGVNLLLLVKELLGDRCIVSVVLHVGVVLLIYMVLGVPLAPERVDSVA
jgi:hypothetical protein